MDTSKLLKGVIDINTTKNRESHAAQIAEKIWLEHEKKIRDFCKARLTGYHREFLDDCMQEIFIGLLEYVQRDAPMNNPRALLYSIAKGKVYDIIRRESKENKKMSYITDLYYNDELPVTYDMDDLRGKISEEIIEQESRAIIENLTAQEQELLQDIVNNLKLKEIAEKYHMPLTSVWRMRIDLTEKIKRMVEERINN